MPLSESLQAQAFRELAEMTCAHCGKRKERGQSFCRVCYFHLPPDMRRKLYSRDEYPNNYDDAKQYLRINK
jgi:predicted amidophosphoribosyltransferase